MMRDKARVVMGTKWQKGGRGSSFAGVASKFPNSPTLAEQTHLKNVLLYKGGFSHRPQRTKRGSAYVFSHQPDHRAPSARRYHHESIYLHTPMLQMLQDVTQ